MKKASMLYCIVDFGRGEKVLKSVRQCGVTHGTVMLGKGTVHSWLLEALDLNEIRREIVMMRVPRENVHAIIEVLDKEMGLHKPRHGIAFSMPIMIYDGEEAMEGAEEETMFTAIYTIVDRGLAEEAIEAAKRGGARGATIFNARSSGHMEASVLFGMEIDPEKEIVMILAKRELAQGIMRAIRDALHIEGKGHGLIYTMAVEEAFGLY